MPPAGPSLGGTQPGLRLQRGQQRYGEHEACMERFWMLWNQRKVATDRPMIVMFLAAHMVSALRNRKIYFHAGGSNLAFALAWPLALGLCLQWSCASPLSYAAWREVPATLLPLTGCLASCTWEVSHKTLADASLWQEAPVVGAVLFWFAVVFATMAPNVICVGLAWPKRFVWHCAAQALFTVLLLRHVPGICAAPLLQHPASQQQVGWAHAALRACGALLAGRAAMSYEVPQPVQCGGVVSVLVFMLAFVVPVVCTAVFQREQYVRYRAPHVRWDPQPRAGGAESAATLVLISISLLALCLTFWDISVAVYLRIA